METKTDRIMETRTERLKHAIEELKQIDMDVLFPSALSAAQDRAEEDRLLFELKGIVDEVRTSIWCRFKAMEESDQDAQKMVDFYRMRRVVQMLRQVAIGVPRNNRPSKHISSLQEIEMATEAAIELHRHTNTIN
jgi:hypothetical protein